MKIYGPTKWSLIAKSLPGRIGKQCRERYISFILSKFVRNLYPETYFCKLSRSNYFRWHNHLNPDIKKDAWTLQEELALMNAHRVHGNRWAEIAKALPGR